MPMQVQCSVCRAPQSISEASLGYQVVCSRCGKVFVARQSGGSSKPWYLQWYVLAGAGGGVLLLLLLLVGAGVAVSMAMNRNDELPAQPVAASTPAADETKDQPAEEPVPKTYALQMEGPAELTIDAGETVAIDLSIDRDGYSGPLQLTAKDLPAGLRVEALEVPDDSDVAQVTLIAAKDLVAGNPELHLTLQAEDIQATHTLQLTTIASQPLELSGPAAARLHPNGTVAIDVSVVRNGHEGPIEITVGELPKQVTAAPVTVAAEQNAAQLVFKGVRVPERQYPVKLLAKVGKETAEATFDLQVEAFAIQLTPLPFPVEWVKPGEYARVELTIQRKSYQGPVVIDVDHMPDGITAEPLTIPENETQGTLELVAAADAKDMVRSGKIVATADGARAETLLITRVKGSEGSLLGNLEVDEEFAGTLKKGSFGGRLTPETKQVLLDVFGGTAESEEAVLGGLRWLAEHQNADGSWSLGGYSNASGDCTCKTKVESSVDKNNTAATAFGILPMLGAGVTPFQAPDYPAVLSNYTENVKKGLIYLIRNQKRTKDENNGDLQGGMYAHALGTIALCEAYALTKNDDLKVPAQLAVRYLMTAQHGASGSWGYGRNRLGDTSIVGWVVLAIRSGQLAGLPTKRSVLDKTERFLNTTGAGPDPFRFSRYSYKPVNLKDASEGAVKAKLSTTAAGLLSRQYLGWQLDRKEFAPGAAYLMQHLPPANGKTAGPNYYYYYATQVLHHLEGKNWDLWNHYMREHFLRTQETEGHAKGSWSPVGSDYGARGGRIYTTSMTLLTLEAYYRHLPLYRKIAKPASK